MCSRPTADEDADGRGRVSGAERRVRRTRIEALVGRYHRLEDERAVPVHLGVLRRREVEHAPVLGPDDDGPQGVPGTDDHRLLGSLDQTTTVNRESLDQTISVCCGYLDQTTTVNRESPDQTISVCCGSLDQTTTVRGESLPGPDDQRLLWVLGPDDDRARRV